MFLHYFNTEFKCALFAGSVFMIFLASSLVSVAKADGLQWDDGNHNNPTAICKTDDGMALYTMDRIKSVPPDPNPPEAYEPLNPGGPVADGPNDGAPPAATFGWWEIISHFIKLMLSFMEF
jgi:hypothetical protein